MFSGVKWWKCNDPGFSCGKTQRNSSSLVPTQTQYRTAHLKPLPTVAQYCMVKAEHITYGWWLVCENQPIQHAAAVAGTSIHLAPMTSTSLGIGDIGRSKHLPSAEVLTAFEVSSDLLVYMQPFASIHPYYPEQYYQGKSHTNSSQQRILHSQPPWRTAIASQASGIRTGLLGRIPLYVQLASIQMLQYMLLWGAQS